jgi:hypothetical protein
MMSGSRVASAVVVAVLLQGFVFLSTPAKSFQAEDRSRTSQKVSENLDDQIEIQKTKIESANATLGSARLAREIAEIAVDEYEQGILVHEKAALEAEIKIAQDDLKAARERIPVANDRLARIKRASRGSTLDLVHEFRSSDQLEIAQLEERKAGLANEQAKGKLKILLEYAKPKRISELRSEVERAKSYEWASRARAELGQSKLKRSQVRKTKPANQAIKTTGTREDLRDETVNLRITEKSAQANYENAKLTREVAEIDVTECELAIFVQDQATLQGEVKLAEADRDRAREAIEITADRLAKIQRASRGSISDLANEFAFADLLANAHHRLPRAELAVKQLEAKLVMLGKYTKPKHIQELRLAVEKARSDQLAKKAEWQIVQSRLNHLTESIKALEVPKKR